MICPMKNCIAVNQDKFTHQDIFNLLLSLFTNNLLKIFLIQSLFLQKILNNLVQLFSFLFDNGNRFFITAFNYSAYLGVNALLHLGGNLSRFIPLRPAHIINV